MEKHTAPSNGSRSNLDLGYLDRSQVYLGNLIYMTELIFTSPNFVTYYRIF